MTTLGKALGLVLVLATSAVGERVPRDVRYCLFSDYGAISFDEISLRDGRVTGSESLLVMNGAVRWVDRRRIDRGDVTIYRGRDSRGAIRAKWRGDGLIRLSGRVGHQRFGLSDVTATGVFPWAE